MDNLKFEEVGQDPDLREYVRLLRNYYKDSFIDNTEIDKDVHKRFMDEYGIHYFVLTAQIPPYKMKSSTDDNVFLKDEEQLLIGFIGVVNDDVRLAIHPLFKGQGYAKKMLKFITRYNPNCKSKVKKNNTSSLLLFEKSEYFVECDECPDFFYFKSARGIDEI